MTIATGHGPWQTDDEIRCRCGREFCPELARLARPVDCADPRRHDPSHEAGRCPICHPLADGSDAPLAWALAVELATRGRRQAVALAVEEIRAGRTSPRVAGDTLAIHDPTLRTDLELALARRRRRS
jgi:hypothetical protein